MAEKKMSKDHDDLSELDDLDGDTEVNIPGLTDEEFGDDELNGEELEEVDDVEGDDENFDLGDDLGEGLGDIADPVADTPPAASAPVQDDVAGHKALGMTADIPVQVVAVLGKKTVTMQELLQMDIGQIIELGQSVSAVVDLVANGKLIGKGELVEIDGQLGVKIIKMVK